MSSHFRTASTAERRSEELEEVPRRPPGLLLPLAGERLWQPHEDGYWKSLREQWGSTLDLHEEKEKETEEEEEREGVDSASRRTRPVAQSQENNVHIDNDENNAAMFTEQGAVFHIVLPNATSTSTTGPTPVNQYRPKQLTVGSFAAAVAAVAAVPTATNPVTFNERTTRGGSFGTTTRYENNVHGHEGRRTLIQTSDFTINQPSDAFPMPPPPATTKSKSKGKREFKGATLNVSVTTTTKTYGDFSRMNPPPYTPRPTGTERSFGRNGKMGEAEIKEKKEKWPVAKWLFILGFVFPVLWLFGSFLLLTGLRKLSAEHQEESQTHAAAAAAATSTKFDTHHHDYTTDSESQHGNVAHMIVQEVLWSKRCAWAIVILACLCFLALGILKAVGI